MILVKLSSFGRSGKSGETAHLHYIARQEACRDGLRDESGASISIAEALQKYDFSNRTLSDRVIISLPANLTAEQQQQAEQDMLQTLSEKYDSFVIAKHTNTANIHFHCTVQNTGDRKRNFDRAGHIYDLQRSLNNGVMPSPRAGQRRTTQAEIHMTEREEQSWKTDLRTAVNEATRNIKTFDQWTENLKAAGIIISRETEKSLTLQDAEGNKCRLSKLFSGIKSKNEVIKMIDERNAKTELLFSITEGDKKFKEYVQLNASRLPVLSIDDYKSYMCSISNTIQHDKGKCMLTYNKGGISVSRPDTDIVKAIERHNKICSLSSLHRDRHNAPATPQSGIDEQEESWMQDYEREQIRNRKAMQKASHAPSR